MGQVLRDLIKDFVCHTAFSYFALPGRSFVYSADRLKTHGHGRRATFGSEAAAANVVPLR
ncbi:hypothetical protein GCM10008957_40910 [Deinococcus ruber]|uniref:Uncharacterized protein n=1 Tax=Deinococcus ruber TaxID=1848197 RepID=A0A918CI24_9DEIO|nr:hypothetical protein GCM10008957_40910 [Deinococcus ruber]